MISDRALFLVDIFERLTTVLRYSEAISFLALLAKARFL
jgi:hypothetical protein